MSDSRFTSKSSRRSEPKRKHDYSQGPPPLNINYDWCKACNICIALCPTDVFEPDRDGRPILARPENCTQCTICWIHCPDLAITSNYR